MRKINPELWLLLFLVLIAGMLNFLVASQKMALVFYFLPTLYSAYHLGRRHATLTALASVVLVVLLASMNPSMFSRRVDLPYAKWFDIAVWGGVLMVSGYATGTLYERNQKTLREMEDGYDGMLVILQNFLANQKHSDTHAYRLSMCATRIAEGVGLDAGSVEDIRMAALLFNMKDLGITNEVLCKAAQVTQEDLHKAIQNRGKTPSKAGATSGSLQRAIPIFLTERQLRQNGGKPDESFPGSADSGAGGRVRSADQRAERRKDVARAGGTGSDQARRGPLRFAGGERIHQSVWRTGRGRGRLS